LHKVVKQIGASNTGKSNITTQSMRAVAVLEFSVDLLSFWAKVDFGTRYGINRLYCVLASVEMG
jgi:hypothetical protein